MKWATSLYALGKWPRLTELHRRLFGKEFDGDHNALNDVGACMQCYFEMKNNPASVIDTGAISESEDDFDSDRAEFLLTEIMGWASDNSFFDTEFVASLEAQLEARGHLTDRQMSALENIANRFDII
jgi:hypothetical protein